MRASTGVVVMVRLPEPGETLYAVERRQGVVDDKEVFVELNPDPPKILRTERMRPVRDHWMCPMHDCDGEMKYTGSIHPMHPPLYIHKCSKCGLKADDYAQFPRIAFVPEDAP